ncbi:MAG: hypothetical protein FJ308_23910 [Planctomycetes bacterium]|nr:hypothetical protein [Planctomycetota bacterium]
MVDVRRVPGVDSPFATILIDPTGERLVIHWYDSALGADAGWLPLHKVAGAAAVMADVRWADGAAAPSPAAYCPALPRRPKIIPANHGQNRDPEKP